MASGLASFKPHIAQLTVQVCYAVMNIITRVALDDGMNHFTFVAYRQAVASLVISPFAYFLERNERPAMTCTTFWEIFFLALFGITINQNCYFAGLQYTSSTFASATTNLIPVVTFVMATTFRLENVNIRSIYGQAKVVGTVVCVGGAMVMTLYKGPVLLKAVIGLGLDTWELGAMLLFASCFVWSGWITFQAPVVKKYPAQQSLTALMLIQGTVQSFLVALIFERKASDWKLKWDIQLLSIVYSGIFCSAFAFFVQTYCIRVKGPVFAAVFNPTSTILVAILELLILHVKLHLGSLLGAIMIIVGLYVVLWGKAKDQSNLDTSTEKNGLENGSSNNITEDSNIDINQPLLQNEGSAEHLNHSHTQTSHESLC
jgi:drug/metabolite transporter (DMT)-like permease